MSNLKNTLPGIPMPINDETAWILTRPPVVVVVVVVLTLTRIIKSVVTGQAPVTLELRNIPQGKTQTNHGGTRIYRS